ncbi:sensor histidine kinase [Catellatospora sichuanensis]|uniref:sensor histidine kinase n=1 Tax=Catellatospora sichuanensis TaxID=1969805 RepID=UPI001FE669AE|nr:histidine kinase [Catellatospora sichuanensis]
MEAPKTWLAPLLAVPAGVGRAGVVERVRLTVLSAGHAAAGLAALVLALLMTGSFPALLSVTGLLVLWLVVPLAALLAGAHRSVAARLLGEPVVARYADTDGKNPITAMIVWARDPARWRDFAFCWFSGTGGLLMSLVPVVFLVGPLVHVVIGLAHGDWLWFTVAAAMSGPFLLVWWFLTVPMVRARLHTDRAILDHSRGERLRERVAQVVRSRSATVDHNEAELRRIERDLHDGAQARIVAAGMNVGLAEKLVHTDPDTAVALLREAQDTTLSALEDLRTLVRGIHPPILADRGLVSGIEALAIPIPIPVTVALRLPRLAPPVESAAYFAVAECLANVAKHARASRAWVVGDHDGGTLRLTVGDDGRAGADPAGSGLAGVARRLAAFDGTLTVASPAGGGTEVRMEVRCRAI